MPFSTGGVAGSASSPLGGEVGERRGGVQGGSGQHVRLAEAFGMEIPEALNQ